MAVSDIIEEAVSKIPNSKYLRATDIDANISVSEIDLGTDTWFIYDNLAPVSTFAGGRIHGYSVEIKILKKSDFDDNTEQGEIIRNELIPKAVTLRDLIQLDSRHSNAEYDEDYTIDPSDQVKIYDSIMTGLALSFNIYIDNKVVGCGGHNYTVMRNGFIDYNDTTGEIFVEKDTWTDIPNNGQGAFTNKQFPPLGVTELMDVNTGYLDTSELILGDGVFIRNDYTINPNTNNAQLKLRYVLGLNENQYTLEKIIGRLDSGSGQDYRFSLAPDFIYMGDENTRDNPIKIQVYCTSDATLTNAGCVIEVVKR